MASLSSKKATYFCAEHHAYVEIFTQAKDSNKSKMNLSKEIAQEKQSQSAPKMLDQIYGLRMSKKSNQKTEVYDLEELVLKYYPQISYRVKKSVGAYNPEWEDICSEILMSVIEALKKGKFRAESSIGTFIYSITSKKIIDYIRRKSRLQKHLSESKESPPQHQIDPQDYLERKEQTKQIHGAIRKLKPRHADILYLYYYLEVPRAQIAQIYSLSPRWISEIIKSARKSLERIIDL